MENVIMLDELRSKNLITQQQHDVLEPIVTGKVVSVFYELRTLLYLGVMLFTTGMGILIYKNIGDLGHLLSIIVLFALTGVCYWYSFQKAAPYTNEKVEAPTPYFDYIVLLGSLLFISALTYLQIQYEVFDDGLGATTLITAAFFFYAAYRFDNLAILSLGVTALASFWGISASPQKWYSNDFFTDSNHHITALIFSPSLAAAAAILDKRDIKKHFTFTYLNFCLLMFFIAALAGVFINYSNYAFYIILLYAGCGAAVYAASWKKSFLFLVYAFVAGYIGTTYMLADWLMDAGTIFFYFLISCGAFIYFIIKYRNYFKRPE
jgi:hypothetical protein